jgi:hypothetical protein
MKILRTSDIITLKHGELEVDFSPLRYDKSLEVAGAARIDSGNTIVDMARQTALMVKYSVKEVRGVTDYNENAVTIKSINGELNEDDISTIITILSKTPFIAPISYISTSCLPKKYEGIEIKVNGKVLELGE